MMAELSQRLQNLRSKVLDICRISGTTGASVGILHEGKPFHTEHFGHRNVEKKLSPNDETIYYLASLSKSFTAAAVAVLVDQGKITWDVPVSQVYQPLQHRDPEVRDHASILDFLSHRTGLAPKNHLWSQEFGHMSLRRGETILTVTYLEKIADFRSRWIYNNWGYGVADVLIEYLSSHTWSDYLRKHILDPLHMNRTVTELGPNTGNVAEGYMTLANGKPYWVGEPDGEEGDVIEGAVAVKSCVKDLMQYYLAFLSALKQAEAGGSLDRCDTPFVDPVVMVQPHIKLSSESPELDGSYGMGWVRAKLPCTLGAIGLNHAFVDRMPVVGKGLKDKVTCLYHQGSANSFLSSVYLLPESQSGVVVLTNSMSKNDAADWIGELYLETLLDNPQKNDYVRLASNSAQAAMQLWSGMAEELAAHQTPNTPVRPFTQYVGKYYNVVGNYHLEVFVQDGTLSLRFQRERRFAYKLTHYEHDTFSWLLSHDQDVRVGRFPIIRASFYLLHFKSAGEDPTQIDSLVWAHDDEVLEGEIFFKKDGQLSNELETIKPESKVIPAAETTFPSDDTDDKNRLVPFPIGEDTFLRKGMIGEGVLVETELEDLTDGVHNGVKMLDVSGPLSPRLKC